DVGMILATFGLALALFTQSILLSYIGFLLFGFGFAPVSPILFSHAGRVPGFPASRGVSIVALFSYSGLLIIPPCIGTLAKATNLSTALCVVFVLIGIIGIGSRLLKRQASGEPKDG
ncbi:amino acid ABC transporter, permease protein, partial [gut metagenome]